MSLEQSRNKNSEGKRAEKGSPDREISESSLEAAGDKVEEMEDSIEEAIEEHVAVKEKLAKMDENAFTKIAKKLTGKNEAKEIEENLDKTRQKFEETMKPYNDKAESKIREARKHVIEADPNLKKYISNISNRSLNTAKNSMKVDVTGNYVNDRHMILDRKNLNMDPVTMMYCRKISRSQTIMKDFRTLED